MSFFHSQFIDNLYNDNNKLVVSIFMFKMIFKINSSSCLILINPFYTYNLKGFNI